MRKLVAPRASYPAAAGAPNPANSTASGAPLPAPVGGWDAISPLAAMPPTRAVYMENWFPQPGYLELRKGFVEHADTDSNAAVETMMPYLGVDAANRLFAVSNGTIYDVTNTGTPGVPLVTGLTNSRFQWVAFSGTGGNFLYAVNGAERRYFNGTVWATPTITLSGGASININAHKRRLWFIPVDSTTPEYLPVDQIQGSVSQFPIGGLMTKGGYVVDMATWSVDGGNGPDDYAVFVTSQGQMIIFQGTNPALDFFLVGVFNIGVPIGHRCTIKNGADVAIITVAGVVPLSKSLVLEESAQVAAAVTQNIQEAMNRAARRYKDNFGWELVSYPRGTRLILNVPVLENEEQEQYVMNTITGAWCRFTGMNACSWCVWEDRLFFGGTAGQVYEADKSGTDATGTLVARFKGAFNYFNTPGYLKQWPLCQPLLGVDNTGNIKIAVDVDFRDDAGFLDAPTILGAFQSLWGVAEWGESVWGGATVNVTNWVSVQAIGQCAAVKMEVQIPHPGGDVSVAVPELVFQVYGFNMVMRSGGGFM